MPNFRAVTMLVAVLFAAADASAESTVTSSPLLVTPAPEISTTYLGIDQARLERKLAEIFNAAYREIGTHGYYYITVSKALEKDFGYRLQGSTLGNELVGKNRIFYGLRISDSAGIKDLPPEALQVFEKLPKAKLTPFTGVFADMLAGVCQPAEQSANERIVSSVATAKAPKELWYRFLDWNLRMRDAGCIGADSYEAANRSFVRATVATFDSLTLPDRLLAAFVLLRAGHDEIVSARLVSALLDQQAVEIEWDGTRSAIFGRRDVMLAGVYVLSHVLAVHAGGKKDEALAVTVKNMRKDGMVPLDTPFDWATKGMRVPRGPSPAAEAMKFLQELLYVKELAEISGRLPGPVNSCGCNKNQRGKQ